MEIRLFIPHKFSLPCGIKTNLLKLKIYPINKPFIHKELENLRKPLGN